MLDEYVRNKWINHPRAAAMITLTSMQHEGKLMAELVRSLAKTDARLDVVEEEVKKLVGDVKDLRKKNPSRSCWGVGPSRREVTVGNSRGSRCALGRQSLPVRKSSWEDKPEARLESGSWGGRHSHGWKRRRRGGPPLKRWRGAAHGSITGLTCC